MGEHEKQRRIIDRKLRMSYREKPCVHCGGPAEGAHIQSRGASGDDIDSNLIAFCRSIHRLQHDMGWAWLCEQYPEILKILNEKGWEFSYEFGEKQLARKY